MKLLFLIPILFVMALQGCATYKTVSNATAGSPKVYSGTRLNITALSDNELSLKKHTAAPPKYPLLDLPFSIVADTIVLPLSFNAALYDKFFEK